MTSQVGRQCVVWGMGILGIVSFAATFPVTRGLLPYFSPLQLGSGRVVIAGVIATTVLVAARAAWPPAHTWRLLIVTTGGVGVGFPVLSALALEDLAASSAAVLGGILPLLTALAAMWIAGERPGADFWRACGAGCCAVVAFALFDADLSWRSGNTLLFAAVICAAIGYATGGRLSRQMPAWQVTCWVVALATPINACLLIGATATNTPVSPAWSSPGLLPWLGLLYLAVFSQLVGFICWNFALAHGGIARVGQLQLLQPFLTLTIAHVWLGEALSLAALLTACIVVASLSCSRRQKHRTILIPKETAV